VLTIGGDRKRGAKKRTWFRISRRERHGQAVREIDVRDAARVAVPGEFQVEPGRIVASAAGGEGR
jgi:hypothetical protein